jgi:hypothetical protein
VTAALWIQTAGALLILVCYAAQLYTQDAREQSKLNLGGNFVGSSMVAATSIGPQQWGTILLEGTWAAIAAGFLVRALVTSGLPRSAPRSPERFSRPRAHVTAQDRHDG